MEEGRENISALERTPLAPMEVRGSLSPRPRTSFSGKLLNTTLEKSLLLLCAVLLLSLLAISLREPSETELCLSEACVHASSDLLASIDHSVDPCDDFFQYACGKWISAHPIAADRLRVSTLSEMADRNLKTLHNLLSKTELSPTEERKIYNLKPRTFFRSCMDTDSIETSGTEVLDALVARSGLLVWKDEAASSWTADDWLSFNKVLAQLHWILIPVFFDWGVEADLKDSRNHVFLLGQSGLTLPSKLSYKNTSDLLALKMLILGHFRNWKGPLAIDEEKASRLVQLEVNLSEIFLDREVLRDPANSNEEVSWNDLQSVSSQFNLKTYVSNVLKHIGDGNSAPRKVVFESTQYFRNLQNLFQSTPKSLIRDYIMFKIVDTMSPYLGEAFQETNFAFLKAVFGLRHRRDRWETCVDRTYSRFGLLLSRGYLESQDFDQDSRSKAQKLVVEVQKAFKEGIRILDWMDRETKKKAVEKINASSFRVGFPDIVFDDQQLKERFEDWEVKEHDFSGNVLRGYEHSSSEVLRKLHKKVDKSEWKMSPADVNAYFSNSENQLVFPAGILQVPLFHKDFIDALNFGASASVVGHEQTHGVDDVGRKFNKDGNLEDWWQPHTRMEFEKRAKCFVNQYDGVSFDDKNHLNGNLTLGENIADNIGLKYAYLAFKEHSTRNRDERRLPALEHLTPDQIFFLAFARLWCSSERPEALANSLRSDVHSPRKIRVQATLRNSAAFSSSFQCPEGSSMNPGAEHRCEIW